MDIFHPRCSFSWQHCSTQSLLGSQPQCVFHHGRIYVSTPCEILDDLEAEEKQCLHVLSADFTSWTSYSAPTMMHALATYRNQLVLVGGRDVHSYERTDRLWVSEDGVNWKISLPPLTSRRCLCSAISIDSPEYLVVIGGEEAGGVEVDKVDVLVGDAWMSLQPLPDPASSLRPTLHNGTWHFKQAEDNHIYSVERQELIQACNGKYRGQSMWKKYPAPPHLEDSCLISNRKDLLAVGTSFSSPNSLRSKICAYSTSNFTWVHIGDLPFHMISYGGFSTSTGELVVMGEKDEYTMFYVLKASMAGAFASAISLLLSYALFSFMQLRKLLSHSYIAC